ASIESAGRAVAPGGALEIRLQIHQVDRALQFHRSTAEELLGGVAGVRIRLRGERQSASAASRLEPGPGRTLREQRAPTDAPLQRLWRVRRRSVQRAGPRAALGLSDRVLSGR